MAGNFNQCLSQAKGKYIKFLNSDDKFHPKLLSRFVSAMEEHPEVTLVTCVQELFGEIHFTLDMPYFGLQKGAKVIQDTLKTYNWIGAPSSVMFRRSPHHFRTDLSWILDWEMWIRQLLEGDCFIVSERLTFIRAHANQATTILRENCLARFEEYQLYSDIYAGQKLEIDQEILYRLVKSKAKNCAVVAFKKILKINKKAHMEIFLRALRIAIKEQVLYSTLSEKFYMLLAPHIPRPIRAVPAIYKKYYSTATRKRKTSYKPKQDAQFLISNNIDKLQA
jgi:glycosyltransferase involved in cell wall biosynthesis